MKEKGTIGDIAFHACQPLPEALLLEKTHTQTTVRHPARIHAHVNVAAAQVAGRTREALARKKKEESKKKKKRWNKKEEEMEEGIIMPKVRRSRRENSTARCDASNIKTHVRLFGAEQRFW